MCEPTGEQNICNTCSSGSPELHVQLHSSFIHQFSHVTSSCCHPGRDISVKNICCSTTSCTVRSNFQYRYRHHNYPAQCQNHPGSREAPGSVPVTLRHSNAFRFLFCRRIGCLDCFHSTSHRSAAV